MRLFASFLLSLTLGVPATLHAQQPSAARLDLTLGASGVRGGIIAFRSGALADVFAAGRLRPIPGGALVAGLGASGIMGGFGDRCLILPNGGCAGKGNFTVVSALLGVDRALGAGSLRLLAGPSYHDGAKDASVGLQGRIDVASPAFAHLALGVMTRATVLPDHGGAKLVIWGFGVGVAFR
jgi:hypothetical protein